MANIEYYRKRNNAAIHAYVVMPNHLNLLASIPEEGSISFFVGDMKKRIAYEYYRLISSAPFPFWEHRFDDLGIYSQEIYRIKLNYIHNNPVRAGLVLNPEDWPYSSAKFYLTGEEGVVKVTPVLWLKKRKIASTTGSRRHKIAVNYGHGPESVDGT